MLVYSIYPKGYISTYNYTIPGYLESANPVVIPYNIFLKEKRLLKPAVYTPSILKDIFDIETSIRFSFYTIKYLPFESLVELQQKIQFPLRHGRALEDYRASLIHFLGFGDGDA